MQPFGTAEERVVMVVQWVRLGVEILGASAVALSVTIAAWMFMRALLQSRSSDFNSIRLVLARYSALALEFQLGAAIFFPRLRPRGKKSASSLPSPLFALV